jgi:hypothetical protein
MTRRPPSLSLGILALAAALSAAPAVHGQEPEAKYSNWTKVENAPETRALRQQLRDGSPFDAKARDFVVRTVVPQLGLEANRPTIERMRRKIRDLLLADVADNKTFDDVSKVVLEAFAAVARNGDAEPVVRVNAMLLVGELRDKANRPLAAALAPLVASAGDVRLPMEVRIAAAAGIARHAEAAKAGGDETAVAQAVAPAIAPMLSGTPATATDWLAGRALAIVQTLGPKAATKEALAAAGRILGDPDRAVDLRVRAAAALGAAAAADSGVDVGRAVASVQATAMAGLQADAAAAESRRDERRLAGTAAPGAGPTPAGETEPTIPKLACRRNAWRLWTCADALASDDGATGLATLLGGEAAEKATTLATALRAAAKAIDAHPDEQAVLEALESRGGPAAAGGRGPRPPARRDAPPPDEPATGESPFDVGTGGR